jgi:rRNA maturation endonuclease Nob1
MNKQEESQAIPREVALRLCEEIRKEKARKWFSQCWGCVRFTKNDPTKMCFSGQPDNRGCHHVNELYDRARKL